MVNVFHRGFIHNFVRRPFSMTDETFHHVAGPYTDGSTSTYFGAWNYQISHPYTPSDFFAELDRETGDWKFYDIRTAVQPNPDYSDESDPATAIGTLVCDNAQDPVVRRRVQAMVVWLHEHDAIRQIQREAAEMFDLGLPVDESVPIVG